MPYGLITLPLRLSVGAARVALGVSERAVSLAWSTVESVLGDRRGGRDDGFRAEPRGSDRPRAERPAESPAEPERGTESEGATESGNERNNGSAAHDPRAEFELGDPRVAVSPPPPEPRVQDAASPPPSAEPVPEHLSTEPELVESFAEPGAEDGAGAQVRVDEPWEGYSKLNAGEVVQRLSDASASELGAVELYEAANKARTTVLDAVGRQLKIRAADAGDR